MNTGLTISINEAGQLHQKRMADRSNAPLYFFQAYLTATVLLYAFGPWPWPTENKVLLYAFLTAVQISLWFGYKSGVESFRPSGDYHEVPERFLYLVTILNLIWIIPTYQVRMGGGVAADIGSLGEAVIGGILDPGARYGAKVEGSVQGQGGTTFSYLSELAAPLLWAMLPLGVIYWERLSGRLRGLIVVAVVLDVLSWIAIGTNKGLFDIVITLGALTAAKLAFSRREVLSMRSIKIASGVLVMLAAAVAFFAEGQEGRQGGVTYGYDRSAEIAYDPDNWLLAPLPESLQVPVAALTSYLTQGYYPLSLSFSEDFQFSYGVGHSYYYTGIVQSFVGAGRISDRTYPAAVEKYGWDRFEKWHSIYPWIASDLTYFGAIIFVFWIGRLLAHTWMGAGIDRDPAAAILLSLLAIMIFYFPANNQVLAFSKTANAFWATLCFWLYKRRR